MADIPGLNPGGVTTPYRFESGAAYQYMKNEALYKISCVQAEMEYLKAIVSEQKSIIAQLTKGPTHVVYIHPYDLMEVISNLDTSLELSYVNLPYSRSDSGDITVGTFPFETTYRQSIHMPKKSDKIS